MPEEDIYEVHIPQAKKETGHNKTLKMEISIEVIYKLTIKCQSEVGYDAEVTEL